MLEASVVLIVVVSIPAHIERNPKIIMKANTSIVFRNRFNMPHEMCTKPKNVDSSRWFALLGRMMLEIALSKGQ